MSATLYVCRHGQSEWNLQGLLQGQLDSPLTELGQIQARALADKARHWNITQVVTSHLGRAKHSGQICADILQVEQQVINGIQERNFATWQGQAITQLDQYQDFKQRCYQQLDLQPSASGESSRQLIQRMLKALVSIVGLTPKDNTLVISHGDALSCLMSQWVPAIVLENTQGIQLHYNKGDWQWGGLLD